MAIFGDCFAECGDTVEVGITNRYPPCSYLELAYNYIQAGYVGNVCINDTQNRLNIAAAGFWLYSINVGIDEWRMDELMETPNILYGSTLENTFVDNFCYMLPTTEAEAEWICETYLKLQESLGDCCVTSPFGGCITLPFGPSTNYVARSYATYTALVWIRSEQAYGGPPPNPNPGITPGEWYNIGTTTCESLQADPTYSYWFINANTFPVQGSRYVIWSEEIINYILNDRVIFNGEVWKVAVAGPLAGGWATRPGAIPGDWIKLS
tara:strand:+ start:6221 stop:7018 length:798 start_codon:yes stop_codon:yes gene_type:complete